MNVVEEVRGLAGYEHLSRNAAVQHPIARNGLSQPFVSER